MGERNKRKGEGYLCSSENEIRVGHRSEAYVNNMILLDSHRTEKARKITRKLDRYIAIE